MFKMFGPEFVLRPMTVIGLRHLSTKYEFCKFAILRFITVLL